MLSSHSNPPHTELLVPETFTISSPALGMRMRMEQLSYSWGIFLRPMRKSSHFRRRPMTGICGYPRDETASDRETVSFALRLRTNTIRFGNLAINQRVQVPVDGSTTRNSLDFVSRIKLHSTKHLFPRKPPGTSRPIVVCKKLYSSA